MIFFACVLFCGSVANTGGLEICRRLREAEQAVYIILLTARGGKTDVVEGLRAGAEGYLIKPFEKDELHA